MSYASPSFKEKKKKKKASTKRSKLRKNPKKAAR